MEQSPRVRSVLSTAGWVNSVVTAMLLFAVAVLATKVTAGTKFKIPGTEAELELKHAWMVFAAFTVGHLYVAVLFKKSCEALFYQEHQNAKATWEDLTRDGPLFFRGLMPRNVPADGSPIVQMDSSDPTTWLAHLAAILFFVAIVPFERSAPLGMIAAPTLTVINWTLGSHWVIAASELTLETSKARVLRDIA